MREDTFFRLVARLERYELENIELYQEIREWRELVQHMAESSRTQHKIFQTLSDRNSLYLEALRDLPSEMQSMFWAAVEEREGRKEARNGAANLRSLSSAQGVW
ncbi:tRNA pseudouridine(13) synthase TruD [uncultured Desulfovibrio sp.]|uniref:tRNA pseudouridine(13) synthase TruD n=1 Tax=uncultured Desulfovibrio sp. TaxID=167968 RepID=UPI0026161915|nr:tRNA pseudouridine(13) synthase TruD [uncultured Desulfovibrio sp.]